MSPLTYHIYNRGVKKHLLFNSVSDYNRFIQKTQQYCIKYQFKLYALALMPNHIHILPSIESNHSKIPNLMHAIGTSYSMYFNKKYGDSGHVFQGRYQKRPIHQHIDVLRTSKYIHQNPQKMTKSDIWKDIVSTIRTYKWSTYRYYLKADRPEWLDYDSLLYYFRGDVSMLMAYMEEPYSRLNLPATEGILVT